MATILIVDDDAFVRQSLRWSLEDDGHTVIDARNGSEGLTVFNGDDDHDIDLVITDLEMPRMNGVALIAAIHKIQPGFPVILNSAHMNVESIAAEAGASRFFQKGTSRIRTLLDYVRELTAPR